MYNREFVWCKSQLVVLTISSLWSSKFLRKDENSCKDSSEMKHMQTLSKAWYKQMHACM